jgi:hypothetical protein
MYNKGVYLSWEEINKPYILYYIGYISFIVNENDYHSQKYIRGKMKKIFVIEINEKDKNIENYEVMMALDNDIKEFADKLRENDNLYIQLKRTGSIWRNLIHKLELNLKENKIKKDNNDSNDSKGIKHNHLKIVK